MKIKLPHRVLFLKEEDKNLSGEEKVSLVNEILSEKVIINQEEMTLEEFYIDNKHLPSVIVALDMFSYYITKEHRVRQDIMTRETIKKMLRGDGRTINFTNLSYDSMVNMGMVDDLDDSNYN